MAMAGRHIRHDWQQFVPWEQKSVRTLCGRTSTWNATGIPGVTDQPLVVDAGGKRVYGWCTQCARSAYVTAGNVLWGGGKGLHPYIEPMYRDVYDTLVVIYNTYDMVRRGVAFDTSPSLG